MKSLTHKISLFLFCILLLSCKKDKHSAPEQGIGTLSVNIEMNIEVIDLPGILKSTAANTDSFAISIYNASDALVQSYAYALEMPDNIELQAGEYYVVASYGDDNYVGFEMPYLTGQSPLTQVNAGQSSQVSVNSAVANCAVSINYLESVTDQFDSYSTEVSSAHGSLTFNETESRYGYFPLSPLSIECTLDGPVQKTLQGQIPNPQPGKLYEININTTLINGQLAVEIVMDESLETEVIEISDDDNAENHWLGALVITEIMYDPDALTDSDGEWFEIYNPTDSTININNLVIRKDNDDHVIAEDKELAPGAYYAMSRTDTATSVDSYVYGTGISLNNSGASLGLYTYGTDGSDGMEICQIAYTDGGDFPSGVSGTAIQLSVDALSVESAQSGSNWCHATDSYDGGDLGTPGAANNSCN
ncbi:MAG: DUF4493 domain-containing protein [Bacteroidetes bacterium]|jgi:hypothetical protein|nr:DUF4493 domain-containing protein [Bacteroidota bacterium]